ncbi:hypothetical protein T484DRAFT_1803995 [Baffinella frigidus]|nr:hypothetical protein T484DRAFT_1803995 [Cryptophyta sp. CCMP2293]
MPRLFDVAPHISDIEADHARSSRQSAGSDPLRSLLGGTKVHTGSPEALKSAGNVFSLYRFEAGPENQAALSASGLQGDLLSLIVGDVVQHESGWWFGSKFGGQSGWFAASFTTGTRFQPYVRKGRRRHRDRSSIKREQLSAVSEDGVMEFYERVDAAVMGEDSRLEDSEAGPASEHRGMVLQVTVPEGLVDGQDLIVRLPNQEEIRVKLPPNALPGSTLDVIIDRPRDPPHTENNSPLAAAEFQGGHEQSVREQLSSSSSSSSSPSWESSWEQLSVVDECVAQLSVVDECVAQMNAAVHFCSHGLALDPDSVVLRNNRSAAFHQMGRGVDALADATECLRIDPTFYKGWLRSGHALLRYRFGSV